MRTVPNQAFTIVETLVAVAILALAVAGPLLGASRALVAVEIAQDQAIATYLAQEGIEYVRAVRDNSYLATYPGSSASAWSNFKNYIEPLCAAPKVCTIDPAQPIASAFQSYSPPPAPPVLSTSTLIYTQVSTPPNMQTKFTRTVQVGEATPTDEHATSTVSWTFHGTSYSVVTTDDLTPWQN